MKRSLPIALLFPILTALPGIASAASSARDVDREAAQIVRLSATLDATAEIARRVNDPSDLRAVVSALLDSEIDALREPRTDGRWRWASLQREEGPAVIRDLALDQSAAETTTVTLSAPRAWLVRVTVENGPPLLFDRVVATMHYFDGRDGTNTIPVNELVTAGTPRDVPLADIAKNATVNVVIHRPKNRSRVRVALIAAPLDDDPRSPWAPAVQRLRTIRASLADVPFDRDALIHSVETAATTLPEKIAERVTSRNAAARKRRELLEKSGIQPALSPADASPSLAEELERIAALLDGTPDQQAAARRELRALLQQLTPSQAPHNRENQ
ncbi:MAG: hypothetical protein WBX15_16135 [Thermoanaerobaculia bacterium]